VTVLRALAGASLLLGLGGAGCLGGERVAADGGLPDPGQIGEGEGEGAEGEGAEGEGEGAEGEGEGAEGEGAGPCQPLPVTEHPDARTFGSACTSEADCISGVCTQTAIGWLCSKFCEDDRGCPVGQGWHCRAESLLEDGRRACLCLYEPG